MVAFFIFNFVELTIVSSLFSFIGQTENFVSLECAISCMVNVYSVCWMMNLLLVLCKYRDLSGSRFFFFFKYYSLLRLLSISTCLNTQNLTRCN